MLFMKIVCVIQTLDLCFMCGRHEKEVLLREALEEGIVEMIKDQSQ